MIKNIVVGKDKIEIGIPLTPNFILVNHQYTPIQNISADTLKKVVNAWKENLFENHNIKK